MSDFLDNFNKNNYKNVDKKKKIEPEEKKDEDNTKDEKIEKEEQNSLKEATFIKKEEKSNFEKNTKKDDLEEHEIEIDYNYREKVRKRNRIIIICSVISIILIGIIIFLSRLVKVEDFTGKDYGEIKTWAFKNDIELDTIYEYDLKTEENQIFYQSVKAGKKIFKGGDLSIKVSKGADPEEKIIIPDLENMKLKDIEDWIDTNKLNNANIVKSYSDKIATGKVIKYEFKNSDVTKDDYRRKDVLIITVSKGVEVLEANIEVKDFVGKTKAEVEEWANTNGIKVTYKNANSNTVEIGQIISQSVKEGKKISKNDAFTITISIGKSVTVPDFSKVLKENAAGYNGLNVNVKEYYSDAILYGGLISQSIAAGTKLTDPEKYVDVIYSLGRPYIDDLRDKTEKDLAAYFYDYKAKGANITYKISYVNISNPDEQKRGDIKSASKYNEYIDMNTEIIVEVYR